MDDSLSNDSNRTISWVSYILHLIVAVSAIIPGAQVGPVLLVVALVMDLVKKSDVGDFVKDGPPIKRGFSKPHGSVQFGNDIIQLPIFVVQVTANLFHAPFSIIKSIGYPVTNSDFQMPVPITIP